MDEKKIEKKEDGGNAKQKKFGTWKIFLTGLVFLFALLSFTLYFSLQFLLGNWNELTVDEILYHIKSPMGGAGPHLVQLFLLSVLLPAVSLFLLLLFIYFFFKAQVSPPILFYRLFCFCPHDLQCLGQHFPRKLYPFPDTIFFFYRRPLCGS